MCGIAGIAALPGAPPPSREQLEAMVATLVHRGPDDDGFVVDGGVALGMRRLAILDVDGGRQPLRNEDGSVRAVFNGEIYNYRELRGDLTASGHALRSLSDGEVLPHLVEEHGAGFAPHLSGMFAVAVHDARRRRLLLARDRLGVKPLYYALSPSHLVFGSEIKALLASGLLERRLDVDALGQFLAWEYVPAPRTLLAGVRKLEPGTLLELDLESGRVSSHTWWQVPSAEATGGGDWEEEVDACLRRCVERQLVSDVPLGALLSGGVDSSLVVAAMGEARTFSIGFRDPSYDESRWARRVAEHLGVRHRLEVQEPDAGALFERLMPMMDDPIADTSIFPTYLACRLARQEVTVALTGDGGDELFGGYETYLAEGMARLWGWLPGPLRRGVAEPVIAGLRPRRAKKGLINKAKRFVEGVGHDPRLGHARWRLFVGAAARRRLFTADALARLETPVGAHVLALAEQAGERGALDRALFIDLKSYLADNCLLKVDRMSMACSLEARVPLLDHELVELAFRVPPRLKVARRETKVLLKRVAARHLPKGCVYRPKEGFSSPVKQWLGGELRPLMEELLARRRLEEGGLFQPDVVDRLRREHLAGSANHSHVLWALMVFEDWRRRWSVGS